MDFTPFVTSIEGHSHIALKIPCNEDGSPKVTVVTGIAPNLSTLNIGNVINNGTLDGNSLDLSAEGTSCFIMQNYLVISVTLHLLIHLIKL